MSLLILLVLRAFQPSLVLPSPRAASVHRVGDICNSCFSIRPKVLVRSKRRPASLCLLGRLLDFASPPDIRENFCRSLRFL
jgi:hypothetical protein